MEEAGASVAAPLILRPPQSAAATLLGTELRESSSNTPFCGPRAAAPRMLAADPLKPMVMIGLLLLAVAVDGATGESISPSSTSSPASRSSPFGIAGAGKKLQEDQVGAEERDDVAALLAV